MINDKPNISKETDRPTIFKNWSTLYLIVIILHIILITFFTLLTKVYS